MSSMTNTTPKPSVMMPSHFSYLSCLLLGVRPKERNRYAGSGANKKRRPHPKNQTNTIILK